VNTTFLARASHRGAEAEGSREDEARLTAGRGSGIVYEQLTANVSTRAQHATVVLVANRVDCDDKLSGDARTGEYSRRTDDRATSIGDRFRWQSIPPEMSRCWPTRSSGWEGGCEAAIIALGCLGLIWREPPRTA
jgi:hypothetical protein